MFANWREGDTLYVYRFALPAFELYAGRYGFGEAEVVAGTYGEGLDMSWDAIRADIARLAGRTAFWFVFTHSWRSNGMSEVRAFRYERDGEGCVRHVRRGTYRPFVF